MIPDIWFRMPGNYDPDEASEFDALDCAEHSMTQQHYAIDADIATIVRRYGMTGSAPMMRAGPVEYGDFSNALDFHDMMEATRKAQQGFAVLPADMRAIFENDVTKFVEFVHDPENYDHAAEMGLFPPRGVDVSPIKVEVVPAPPAPPAPAPAGAV